MDEATWAMLLCKDNSADDPVNSIQEYRDDNHNNIESIQQHITDISNSFMEDGGNGQYNNSNSSNSNLSVNNYNNNNDNLRSNNNFNNTFSKEYLRIGSNGLPLRSGSPVMNEFIDLDKNYHLAMMHYSNHHHHHNLNHHNQCNNNANTVIFSTMPPEEQLSNHQYTDADHNHYHLQNHHLLHRLNYNNVGGPIPHYNTGTDTSSSNSSSISAQRNHSSNNNNNNERHQVSSYLLRKGVQSTSAIREIANQYDPYVMHQSMTSYSNTDQESCSDSESRKPIVKTEPSTYPARRRPGRPRGSRRKKPEKLGRLWEFIRDLLLNPESCPSLICWDNYEEGMFRFVRSDKVAKLWGEKRDNPDMNYEKLSRAMRYYYKSNVLQPVFGRRLVYKFGPEARGWKTENPNFTC